ncbi:uncharacterized protein LOC128986794 [Macrosteles quadrilineatus]|uniref:uncharacterized protein LOC128986794 n=1 Tax=Macrosteles quadrilineatus TaxID=74068 RepID=UPI0023E1048F|nr:uncharacterized protein LOC128986794 [Macrosteles quadrilineatus]
MLSMNKLLFMHLLFIYGAHCNTDLKYHMQPDDVDSGKYDQLSKNPHHICTRVCKPGDYRVCYYRFVVEHYMTMNGACGNCPNDTSACSAQGCVTADGFEKSVITFNRKLPGPSIQVCKGDTVIVDLKNHMAGACVTIHWHGHLQKHSKFMDGVPMVTQCPILEGQIFRYTFKADYPGTQWYHSHSGLQKVDGMAGALIIRCPKEEDPHRKLYDYDLPSHVLVVQDLQHNTAETVYPGVWTRGLDQLASTYLINGRGHYLNGTKFPLSEFNVTKGKRYVFRVIAATCYTCQYSMSIEKHKMTILGADGSYTKPYEVDRCNMSPGERFTVKIDCNQKKGAYWIRVRSVGACASKKAYQLAILRYNGYNGMPSTPRPNYDTDINDAGTAVNPSRSNCTEENRKTLGPCISQLQGTEETPKHILQTCDQTVIMAVGFYRFPNNTPYTDREKYPKYISVGANSFSSTVNGKTYILPPSPLLSQYRDVPGHLYCPQDDYSNLTRWNTELHECVHVIKLRKKTCVKFIIVDTGNFLSHPMHLHGYNFYVSRMGILPGNGTFSDKMNALLKEEKNKPCQGSHIVQKDTVAIPPGGYCIACIYTDNPGYWLFHCHFAYHYESGMGAVMMVGEEWDIPKPPEGFPTCGDYLPRWRGSHEKSDEYSASDSSGYGHRYG